MGSTTAPPVEWAMDPTDADNQYVLVCFHFTYQNIQLHIRLTAFARSSIFAFNSPGKVWTLSNGDNYTVVSGYFSKSPYCKHAPC